MPLLAGTRDGIHPIGEDGILLAGHPVTAAESDGQHLWALTDGTTLWRSGEQGLWTQAAGMGPHGLRGTCVCTGDGEVLVGTSEAHLVRLSGGELDLMDPFEGVAGRDTWHTPWGGPPDVRSISRDPGAVYANVHVGGIVRSTDGGETWEPTIDIHSDVHQVLAVPGLVLAAAAVGLAVSADGGATWEIRTEGLHATYSRAVAVCGDTVLVSASTGPRSDRAAVYRGPLDGSGPFERCSEGLPEWFTANIDTFCLAGEGDVAAFGTEDGRVYLSEDAGGTWTVAAGDLPGITCLLFG